MNQYDRAVIGSCKFACMRVEKKKFARDSLVMTKANGKYWAGRVCAFLEHVPPGFEDCHPDNMHMPALAEVAWFANAMPAEGVSGGIAVDLKCPVFKRAWQDDPTGNLWPVDRLAPCKLLSLPHSSHPQNLVVVSRFASFLQQAPASFSLPSNLPNCNVCNV